MKFVNPSESLYAAVARNPSPHSSSLCGPGYVWCPQMGKCVPGDSVGTVLSAMGAAQGAAVSGMDNLVLSDQRAQALSLPRRVAYNPATGRRIVGFKPPRGW